MARARCPWPAAVTFDEVEPAQVDVWVGGNVCSHLVVARARRQGLSRVGALQAEGEVVGVAAEVMPRGHGDAGLLDQPHPVVAAQRGECAGRGVPAPHQGADQRDVVTGQGADRPDLVQRRLPRRTESLGLCIPIVVERSRCTLAQPGEPGVLDRARPRHRLGHHGVGAERGVELQDLGNRGVRCSRHAGGEYRRGDGRGVEHGAGDVAERALGDGPPVRRGQRRRQGPLDVRIDGAEGVTHLGAQVSVQPLTDVGADGVSQQRRRWRSGRS